MIVYVSNADGREISVLRLDASGVLTPVRAVAVDGKVMPLAVSPDRRRLYAGLRSTPYRVAVFEIESGTGDLVPVATGPLPDNMAYLGVDRSGHYLLSASYTGDKVAVQRIGGDGAVGEVVQVLATPPHAHSIVADPSNRYVFVGVLGGDTVWQYRFDGTLTPNAPPFVATKPGAGPRHIAFHPDGRVVYVSNELDGTVESFLFDADSGVLDPVTALSVVPPSHAGITPATSELRVTPDGRYLYVAERVSSSLACFRVDGATGALAPCGHTFTETRPRGFAIDPRGRFLVAAGQRTGHVAGYAIGSGGGLELVDRRAVGADPNWVEIVDLNG
ncbi:lactonase family protein [Nocardia sp. NPDC052566]|uniref:lactonase family protein n=1 Tax=Nocardia sp. NPDC052566 TaxID=3364330 RepID=UPI0037CB1D1F